ncbi:hypothetical protein B566_EDAN013182 [Ephemera danica]|nr:hypothetical protein B566_EDAN013182 [Ephemera danica]
MVHPERHKLGPAPPIPLTNNFAASMADAAMTRQSSGSGHYTLTLQPAAEGGSMERHPEESVSIVETLEDEPNSPFARSRDFSFLGGRHSMCAASLGLPGGTGEGSSRTCSSSTSGSANSSPFLTGPGTGTRRKLYFNPAYFEPEMLHAPPPAALEFLQKLREVITMSKHKMTAKKFSPSLLGIPEERDSVTSEQSAEKRSWAGSHSRRSDTASVLPDIDDVNGSKQQTIRRWLEDLESGDPVEDVEPAVEESKAESIIPAAPPPPPLPVISAPPSKKLMDAVIKELVRERGLTPAESTSDDTNLSSEKPADQAIMEDNDYEMITMQATASPSPQPPSSSAPSSPVARPPLMMYCLPELLAKTNGYNLVSEVYVNDGYSSNQSSVSRSSIKKKQNQRQRPLQGSAGSSEHSSPSSLSENPEESGPNFAGRLTIQVAESTALHYRGGYESEEFEPDTLDRGKRHQQQISARKIDDCTDSLERPTKIMLKTSGSFFKDAEHANKTEWLHSNEIWKCPKEKKKRSPSSIADLRSTNFVTVLPGLQKNKEFGSLREIFEAKRQQQLQKQIQELEHMWMPQLHDYVKRGATRSLVEPNELRWRSGLSQQMVDEIRELMWKSTPETGVPLPRVPPTKPKRQRSADVTASPPTPPPSVPPSLPPTLPPKQRKQKQEYPPTPPRDIKPPPILPPKNARGSRSPHSPPLARASAASDEDDDEMQGGSCTLGRKVEQGLSDAFSTWKRQRQGWEPEVRITHRPGDSGYLSSDSSSNSLKREAKAESSETEESLCESESGAESIGTDSFFFGRVRPQESVTTTPRQPVGRYDMAPGTTVVHMPPVPVKKRPPPPPKRVNSRLETKVLPTRNENIVRNLSSQYAL